MKSIRLVFLLSVLVITFTSCLDISMELDLRDDGSAVVDATYDISRQIWDQGAFDADNPNRVIPVSRRDLEELAALWEGVTLTRYRIRRSDTRVTVTFRMHLDDPEALAGLWSGVSPRAASTLFSPGERVLILPITSEREPIDTDAADLVRSELRGGVFRLRLSMPGPINTVRSPSDNRYLLDEGGPGSRILVLEAQLADLVIDPSSYVVELTWE